MYKIEKNLQQRKKSYLHKSNIKEQLAYQKDLLIKEHKSANKLNRTLEFNIADKQYYDRKNNSI